MNQKRVLTRRKPKLKGTKCVDCEHAMFNEQWGDHKCRVKQRSIPDSQALIVCKDFKRKSTKK